MPFASGAPAVADYPAAVNGMNTGSIGGSVASSNVIESIYSTFDPFSIERIAFERHGRRPGFANLIDVLGPDFNQGKKAPTTGHYERNNWVGQLINVGSIVTPSGGAGNTMVIAVGTDNMTDTGVEVSGSARKGSPGRVRDLILLPGGKLAQITTKNTGTDPHRYTLTPMDSTVDLDDYVTASDSYAIVTNAWAPGSALPTGLIPKTFRYTNKFQIIKEYVAIDGSALTDETFVQVAGTSGSVIHVMNQDMMDRFDHARSGALLWGEENTNDIVDTTTANDHDKLISWTEGFMAFQAGNSYQLEYDPSAFTTDEFDEIAATLERENLGTRSVLSLQGNQYQYLLQAALEDKYDQSLSSTLIAQSMTDYNLSLDEWQPTIERQDWIAWLGFQGIRRSNFLFYFRMMHEFVSPDAGGADAYDYPYEAIYMPLSKTRDRQSGVQRTSIGYEWKQLGSYNRKAVYGTMSGAGVAGSGGYATTAVNQYDFHESYCVCEHAFHGACPNKIVYHKQQAA